MNRPRQKGTRYETKLLRWLTGAGFKARRMPMGARWDIEVDDSSHREYPLEPVQALATEPDRGQTLVTVPWHDFVALLHYSGMGARIECKKWRAFPHHTLWRTEMET